MYLGKNIIQDPQPFVDYIVANALEHQDWPDNARFKVSYRLKTWPVGYSETHHVFFTTEAELKAWEREKSRWASLEDNGVEYTVYEWDWGPKVVGHYWI